MVESRQTWGASRGTPSDPMLQTLLVPDGPGSPPNARTIHLVMADNSPTRIHTFVVAMLVGAA